MYSYESMLVMFKLSHTSCHGTCSTLINTAKSLDLQLFLFFMEYRSKHGLHVFTINTWYPRMNTFIKTSNTTNMTITSQNSNNINNTKMSNITNKKLVVINKWKIASSFLNHNKNKCTPRSEQKYATQVSGEFLNEYLKEKKVFDKVN